MVWNIRTLGGLQLVYRDRAITTVNTNRLQALLAYLALHTGVQHSREHLAFLFWPDSTESQARTNLRQLLHHLRSALPDGGQFIETDAQNILWRRTTEFSIDVADFEACAIRAEGAVKTREPGRARKELEEAAAFYRGDFMPGLQDEWAEVERKRLRQKYAEVLGSLLSLLEDMGEFSSALQHAERLLALDPFSEASYQTLMRLHGLKGDRAAALLVYHQCVTVLRREFDTEPGPATRKLRDQVTKQELSPADRPKLSTMSGPTHLNLIGREQEFNRLIDVWKVAAQGTASFVLVTGESGIGKTRLLEELRMWASRQGVSIAQAKCYAAEGRLAYASVADWIRSPAFHSVLPGLPPSQLSELVRVLPELLVEHPELAVPPPLSEGWQRHHFFEALARTVLKCRQPLLLVIDDLQWCDQETLEWLHYLLRLEPQARLLVAGSVRIEDLNDRHALRALMHDLNRDGCSTEIPLGLLNSKDTASLATQVFGRKLDAESSVELYRETEGHPLFIIESVRAGLLSSTKDSTASEKPEFAQVQRTSILPPKVHAVLSARLAQLSSRAQDLTSLAACISRPFTAELLQKASHWDEETLISLLDELWQRRIIRLQGEESYDFSHDKLREVAYSQLSPVRRQLYHRRIAESIATLSENDKDSVSAELARHYEQAVLPALAVPLYYQAARVSQRMYAETEAIESLTRALRLIEAFPQGAEHDRTELNLLVCLGLSLTATQGYAAPEVGRAYARARMLCESLGEKDQYFSVLWGSWVFHQVRGDLPVAREMASRLLQMVHLRNDAAAVAAAHFAIACSLFHLGELVQAREHLQQALSGIDTADERLHLTVFGPDLGVFCLSYMGHVLWMLGDPDQSVEYSRQALDRAERLAHPFTMALALDYASILHQFRDEPTVAAKRAADAAVVCRQYGFSYYLAWTSIIRGWALAEGGAAHEGVEKIQEGLAALAQQRAALRTPYYRMLLAQAFARTGDVEMGLKCLSEALVIREKTGECWSDAMIHQLRASLLRKKGDVGGANRSRQRALSVADRQKNKQPAAERRQNG